jgi:hypothetical protein
MNNLNFSLDFKFQLMFILILVIFIYFNYQINNIKNLLKENFVDTTGSDQKLYQTDITAIRVLASIAASLNNGGLTTPGNLTVGTPTTRQSFIVNGDSKINGDLFTGSKIIVGDSFDNISSTISDSIHVPNSLCIVGQGKKGEFRKINMWDHVEIAGTLKVGRIQIGNFVIYDDGSRLIFGKTGYTVTERCVAYEPWRGGFAVSDGNQSNWRCLISSDKNDQFGCR